MKLIVGLGNPGRLYVNSRHNAGFFVLGELEAAHKIRCKKEKGIQALTARLRLEEPAVLAMPLTFMNLSGSAVKALMYKYDVALSELLVVCDDMDLELGRIKIRPGGSSGGHNGLNSIIDCLDSRDFSRLRVGIGRPDTKNEAKDYVLSAFKRKEKGLFLESIDRASKCVESWLERGMNKTMNEFNANIRS